MRVFAASVVALGLFAMPVMAAGGAANNNADPANPKAAAADPAAKPAPKPANSAATSSSAASPAKPAEAEMETELQQLRDAVAMQAQQIQDQQKKMQQLEDQLKNSSAARENLAASPSASPVAASAAPSASASSAATAPLSTAAVSSAASSSASSAEGNQGGSDQPASWKFKGVTFTPGGFFAAETVWRQRALSADVNTPFSSVPLPGSSQYNLSEFNASGRQSRIAMLVQGKLSNATIGGYYEADFLSAGTTSNSNESNSYTLRQRQFWAQAAFTDGWTVTGGQMWSLVTETAKGLDNRTEQLPMTIDAQYHVGFSWARQYGVRFAKNIDNKMWLGFAVEEPQATFKQHGTTTPFLLGTAGNGGGLLNTAQASYSFNLTPDFIFKAAFEPGFGHYEVFGIISTFRDRVFPTGLSPVNNNQVGGGGGANAWFPFFGNHMDIGIHALVGDGVGRYGTTGFADATAQPNGNLALIRSYQGLGTLEFHYPKVDIYLNAGGEYGARTQFISGAGTIPNEGYGAIGFNNAGCWTEAAAGSGGFSPASIANCTGDVRNIIEGTAGFWYNFYKGPMGQMKFGVQFSHEALNTWAGVGTTGACTSAAHPSCGPSTSNNMVFTSFRYYIP